MKVALAQCNYIVGDITGNSKLILEYVEKAATGGSDLVIFSELAICGYPPLDLLERGSFVESCIEGIHEIAANISAETGVIVGGPEFNSNEEGKLLFNSAWFLLNGKVKQTVRKSLLPTYDIFDEYRYFEPNRQFDILEFRGNKIALTICEDLWDDQPAENRFSRSRLYTRHPLEEMMKFNPDFVVNIAASPFAAGRMEIKKQIFSKKATKHHLPVLMVNQVGANTELIFEGGSLAVAADGSIYKQLALFEEDFAILDTEELIADGAGTKEGEAAEGSGTGERLGAGKSDITDENGYKEKVAGQTTVRATDNRIALINDGLALGVRDYFSKSGFRKATLGLSGGIDSAVTLAIAVQALGNKHLHVLLMPSQYSSDHSISDSEKMARNLQVSYDIIPIRDIFDLYRKALQPVFGDRQEDIAEENIQSRIRGTLLMGLSNKLGHILLNTSNKSETAVGYGTLYGDMAGGLSVLGDVYKVDVYALANYINRDREIIPQNIIDKPPSAELRPDQKDADSLPEYEILDSILELYIGKQWPEEQIAREGFEPDLVKKVIRMVNMSEYKRYQTPPILRISSKAFGVGRRIPIVGRY
ncbi:MAG: NAD+ synthase [Bacteroidales bacterium]|nr:NAD+ synthase [Bacteroidales bacterium]